MIAATAVLTASPAVLASPPARGLPRSLTVFSASLTDVSCTDPSTCMAVGWFLAEGGSAVYYTLAEAWDGTRWRIVPTPTPQFLGGGAELTGVACSGPASCIAVGQALVFDASGGRLDPLPFSETWDGSRWTVREMPTLRNTSAVLNSVACTSAADCIGVGSDGPTGSSTDFTLAERWDGSAWSVLTTPPPPTPGGIALQRVSCPGPNRCMAVGYFGYNVGTGTSLTLAERWNGARWRITQTPAPSGSGTLAGVSCTRASVCTAVGEHARPVGSPVRVTLAESWNGLRWTAVRTPNPAGAGAAGLESVSCPGPDSCMATGSWTDRTGEYGFTLAEQWDGTSWKRLGTPSPGSFADELHGVSCAGPAACMAVGDFIGTGDEFTLAEAWDGNGWTLVKTPQP